MGTRIWLISSLMLVAVVLTACGGGSSSSIEGAIKKIETALNANDPNAAVYELCQPSFRDGRSYDYKARVARLNGQVEVRIEDINVSDDGNRAGVDVLIYVDGRRVTSEAFPLVKEGGAWYTFCN